MKTNLYIPRTYREQCASKNWVKFSVQKAESDLLIQAQSDLTQPAKELLVRLRMMLESYIAFDVKFLTSLKPIIVSEDAPEIIQDMAEAGKKMNVGPMAAVAGAISERIAHALKFYSNEIIVENGGDIYAINQKSITIALLAGNSMLSLKMGIELTPNPQGIGIATSSGTVGHSLSFGNADAVTVLARKGSLADAAATAICNIVKTENDIEDALNYARRIEEILGVVIIFKNRIGVAGEMIKLCYLAD